MTGLSLDPYVVETLMAELVGRDRHPSAFLVYLYLWARTAGARSRERRVAVSHHRMAADTGLSRSAVQAAVRALLKRRLLRAEHASRTAVPEYVVLRPWARPASSSRARA
jgi:hypothetical protein